MFLLCNFNTQFFFSSRINSINRGGGCQRCFALSQVLWYFFLIKHTCPASIFTNNTQLCDTLIFHSGHITHSWEVTIFPSRIGLCLSASGKFRPSHSGHTTQQALVCVWVSVFGLFLGSSDLPIFWDTITKMTGGCSKRHVPFPIMMNDFYLITHSSTSLFNSKHALNNNNMLMSPWCCVC